MANKIVNGKQLTVVWHVDDLKVSHVDADVIDEFLVQLDDEFGKETPMNKSRGRVHSYLGMTLDFTTTGSVQIDMADYIKMVLHELPVDMIGKAVTPACSFLFHINNQCEKLSEEKKDTFVHYVMQLLYLSQRGRPDIRTAISFLCTRLKYPDVDDYKKLTRVLKYLQGSIDLCLTLSCDNGGKIHWWVDAPYGSHPDIKGHSGGTMSMGKGSLYSTSVKQKLVSRSSTESEVVGVYDLLPQIIWTSNFLKDQRFQFQNSVLYQDNKSAILLEVNGRQSSSKRTRHMNIRYFYIKDSVDNKTIDIENCDSNQMHCDFFTKPLQGMKFHKMRDTVMNIDPNSKYHSDHRSVLKVEGNKDSVDDVNETNQNDVNANVHKDVAGTK